MINKIYVGNLPYEMTEGHIEELFSGIGTVTDVKLARDGNDGSSKGFAFVEFSKPEEAADAISKFNSYDFSGRKLKVDLAKDKVKK